MTDDELIENLKLLKDKANGDESIYIYCKDDVPDDGRSSFQPAISMQGFRKCIKLD